MFKSLKVEFHTTTNRINGKTGEGFCTAVGNIVEVDGSSAHELCGQGFQHSTSDNAEMDWLNSNVRKFPVFQFSEVELGEPYAGESNTWHRAVAFEDAKLVTQRRGSLSF